MSHGEAMVEWWIFPVSLIVWVMIHTILDRRYVVTHSGKTAFSELQEFSLFLLAGVVFAQIWAHRSIDSYDATWHWQIFQIGHLSVTPHFLVNDVGMAFFFGVAAKEITEAVMKPGGSLRGIQAALPVVACIGGVIIPALTYFHLATPELRGAWGVPCATDIAFAWLGARMIWGPTHPAVAFLLVVAIVDDFIGMGIIAVVYPRLAFNFYGLIVLLVGMLIALNMRTRARHSVFFRQWLPYMIPGAICWYGLHMTGLHAALALVFVVPFMPMKGRDEGIYAPQESEHVHDAINKFEHSSKPIVDSGLFYFGFANAGVAWFGTSAWTANSWATLIGLGSKVVGIATFTAIGFFILIALIRLGLINPTSKLTLGYNAKTKERLRWYDLPALGILAGVGFTVALFVADAAGGHPALKLGALASFVFLPVGFAVHWVVTSVLKIVRAVKTVDRVPMTKITEENNGRL